MKATMMQYTRLVALLLALVAAPAGASAGAARKAHHRARAHGKAQLRGPALLEGHSGLALSGGSAEAEDGAASAEAVVAEAEREAAAEESGGEDAAAAASLDTSTVHVAKKRRGRAGHKAKVASGPLTVKIVRAVGLRSDKLMRTGVTDPYCTCEVTGKPSSKFSTLAIDGTNGPHWEHEGKVSAFRPHDSLSFAVYEEDSIPGRNLLGTATLPASRILPGGFDGELPLTGGAGSLRLVVMPAAALEVDAEAAEGEEEQTAEEQTTEEQTTEDQASDSQATDSQATDSQTSEEQGEANDAAEESDDEQDEEDEASSKPSLAAVKKKHAKGGKH